MNPAKYENTRYLNNFYEFYVRKSPSQASESTVVGINARKGKIS